jgi:hypothetical protein
MSAEPVEPRAWTRSKYAGIASLIFALHLGLIFWFASVPNARPRPITAPLKVKMLTERQLAELPDLSNPILFVLPSQQGFSRGAWLAVTPMRQEAAEWDGPTQMLPFPSTQPTEELADMVRGNLIRPLEPSSAIVSMPGAVDFYHTNLAVTESSLSVEGPLRSRRMLSASELQSQSAPVILGNSVVQIVVDSEGRLDSPPILLEKSGSELADTQAIRFANTVRFEPVRRQPGKPPDLRPSVGRVVFHWHTVIGPPATNAPPVNH